MTFKTSFKKLQKTFLVNIKVKKTTKNAVFCENSVSKPLKLIFWFEFKLEILKDFIFFYFINT